MPLNRTPREYLDERLAERLIAAGWRREHIGHMSGPHGLYPVGEEWQRYEGTRLTWRLSLSWSGEHTLRDETSHRDERFTSRGLPAALTRRGLLVAPRGIAR